MSDDKMDINIKRPIELRFISYEEFKKLINCEDARMINDDTFETNPLITPLENKEPILLSYILKGTKKQNKSKT